MVVAQSRMSGTTCPAEFKRKAHFQREGVWIPEGPSKKEDTPEPKVLEWPMSQVSQRWDLPSIIKAMLWWTSRRRFVRAAQNVVHWKWSKHIIYMSAFIVDGTHLVCHDQNLRKLICAKIQGDEGLSQLYAAFQGPTQFPKFAVARHPAPPLTDKVSAAPRMADQCNKTSSLWAQNS